MTYSEKHGAIARGIGSGKTNAALAAEQGVSRGMIQKHRSGETASGGGSIHDTERYLEELNSEEFKRYQKLAEWFSVNEMICIVCGVETVGGQCPICCLNMIYSGAKKLPEPLKCPWCETESFDCFCPVHGRYTY